jgi:hypothetical protein
MSNLNDSEGGVPMPRHAALFVYSLCLILTSGASAEEKETGWVQLFNGKDLTGWKVHPSGTGEWKVVDGAIHGSGPASHLFTERGDYQNFHVRFEAKISDKGNSGQYFRTQYGPGFPKGYEAQINSTGRDPIKTGSLYPAFNPKLTGDAKEKLLIKEQLAKPDEWFTQEVIVQGNHIVIMVNGKKTVDHVDEANTFQKGHFAIQQHDPGSKVWVRKVEVKELPATK